MATSATAEKMAADAITEKLAADAFTKLAGLATHENRSSDLEVKADRCNTELAKLAKPKARAAAAGAAAVSKKVTDMGNLQQRATWQNTMSTQHRTATDHAVDKYDKQFSQLHQNQDALYDDRVDIKAKLRTETADHRQLQQEHQQLQQSNQQLQQSNQQLQQSNQQLQQSNQQLQQSNQALQQHLHSQGLDCKWVTEFLLISGMPARPVGWTG